MAQPTIQCPNCGKAYRWQTKIAGRNVRCVCQHKFRVPMTPDEAVESKPDGFSPPAAPPPAKPKPKTPAKEPDPYELDLPTDDTPAAAPLPSSLSGSSADPTKCPSCNSELRPGAVICLNCGFNLAAGAKIQTVVAATEEPGSGREDQNEHANGSPKKQPLQREELEQQIQRQHIREEYVLPTAIIVGGAVLSLAANFLLPLTPGELTLSDSVTLTVISITRNFAFWFLLTFGLFVCASVAGSAAGSLFVAMIKTLAIALLMGTTADAGRLVMAFITEGLGTFGLGAFFRIGAMYVVLWVSVVKFFDFDSLEVQILGGLAICLPLAALWFSPLPWGLVY